MAYELFRKALHRYTSQSSSPAVSIHKQGSVYLNTKLARDFLGGFDYVLLYWDGDSGKVGFKPSKESEGTYKLCKRRGQVVFSATCFLRYIGMSTSVTRRFPASWNEKAGLVEIDVSEFIGKQ